MGSRLSLKPPNLRFPYGNHRFSSADDLAAAAALFTIGGYLLVESALKLIRLEHPTIGSVELFGWSVWLGWLMVPALVYRAIPAIILGRMKLPIAASPYDTVLYTAAAPNKAEWKIGRASRRDKAWQ